ncbi:MAG TPA: hypothetical protein VGL24_09755, partial [Chthoniobacterales bacterium]
MPKEALTDSPFFIAVVAAIEKKIGEGDRIARANNIRLSDAQIVSLLTRLATSARGKMTGKSPPPRNPPEQILQALGEQLGL